MPKLILLPGLDGTGRLFEDLVDALSGDIDCTVVKYPNNAGDDYGNLASFSATCIPESEPCYLLAESFSGPVGVMLAAEHRNIEGLVLACSFISNPHPALAFTRPLVPFLPVRNGPAVLKSALALGKWQTPALREKVRNAVSMTPENVLRARLRQVLAVDVREQARKIRAPVLSIKATHDRLVPARTFRLLARCVPQATLVEFEGPHFILQVKPEECARAVKNFIANTSMAGVQLNRNGEVRRRP